MDISCAFATSPETPSHVALAERLGYRRAWLYDSPALYPDVWVTLALAAQQTESIGLATGVLVPRLRHVMTTAAAAAHIEQLAPGRLTLGIGSGFTGSRALGQKAMKWADVAAYVEALKALLRGDAVEWEGAPIRLIHPDGFAPPLPIEVPIVIAVSGPKGMEVARRLGDGIFTALQPPEDFPWSVALVLGTVLDEGEPATSDRVLHAAGPAAAVAYHGAYEMRGAEAVARRLPGGEAWVRRIEAVPEVERHLAVHEGHLVAMSEIDREVIPREAIAELTLTGTADVVRSKVHALAAGGVTEIAYQPLGPDIPRELESFISAVS